MQLVAGLLPRRPIFNPRSVSVRFVVIKLAMGQVFLRVLLLSPINTIPAMVHTHLNLHAALIRRTNRQSLGTFKSAVISRKAGKAEYKITLLFHYSGEL